MAKQNTKKKRTPRSSRGERKFRKHRRLAIQLTKKYVKQLDSLNPVSSGLMKQIEFHKAQLLDAPSSLRREFSRLDALRAELGYVNPFGNAA